MEIWRSRPHNWICAAGAPRRPNGRIGGLLSSSPSITLPINRTPATHSRVWALILLLPFCLCFVLDFPVRALAFLFSLRLPAFGSARLLSYGSEEECYGGC